jgi:hypothetical protein
LRKKIEELNLMIIASIHIMVIVPDALGSKTSRKPLIETFKYIIKFAKGNTSD